MRNDISLPRIVQFFAGKTLHFPQRREREREKRIFEKDIRQSIDWKSNWVGGCLAVFPPSEIVMENLGSSRLAGVERNKNVPFRQRPDERN